MLLLILIVFNEWLLVGEKYLCINSMLSVNDSSFLGRTMQNCLLATFYCKMEIFSVSAPKNTPYDVLHALSFGVLMFDWNSVVQYFRSRVLSSI